MSQLPELRSLDAPRLHVLLLSSDPEIAFRDPTLALLVQSGWMLFTQFAADFGPSGEKIVIVMQPPRPDALPASVASLTAAVAVVHELLNLIRRWRFVFASFAVLHVGLLLGLLLR
jgi:hypothetical protein